MKHPRVLVAGVFSGLAVVILLAVVIFQFGRRDPSPPSLQDHPNPAIPGDIVYLATNDCIIWIDASGGNKREVVCPGRADFVTRLDERTIVYGLYGPPGSPLTQRDLVSGQEVRYPFTQSPDKFFPGVASDQRSPLDEFITIDRDGSVYRSNGTEPGRVLIFDCDCPQHQAPSFGTWSPDGQWVMLTYWNNRSGDREIWILARDGSFAGTLATLSGAGGQPSWFIGGKGVLPKSTLTSVAR